MEIDSKWDRRFIELARHVAQWSKDPSTKVGAVIVDPTTRSVVGMGYNGFPRGVQDTADRLNDRPTKYKIVAHAELNAILNAVAPVKGCVMYVWPTFHTGFVPTCNECAKAIIQAGITEVIGYGGGVKDGQLDDTWKETHQIAEEMYKEAGVNVYRITEEDQ